MTSKESVILIATEDSTPLAQRIAERLWLPFSEMVRKRFADGEWYHAFPSPVAEKNVVIIGATHNETALQELLDLIAGARFWNAQSISVVVSYLGYSTMERVKPGSMEIPKGITRTRQIFRTLPDYVGFVDLHSEAILHAHDGRVSVDHILTDRAAAEAIRGLGLRDFALVSPDYGFSKRVAHFARILDCPHTAADKDRFDTDKTIVGQVSSVVKGKTVIICDDMIRTGGSIVQTAERCIEAGASEIFAHATHLVMAAGAQKKLLESPIVKIIGSDSYPLHKSTDLMEVYSLAPLLAEVIEEHLQI